MLGEMTSEQISEWIAYDRIEPPPDPFWCAALIATVIANAHGAKSKLEDFLPSRGPKRAQSPAEMMAAMNALAAMQNGAKPR